MAKKSFVFRMLGMNLWISSFGCGIADMKDNVSTCVTDQYL